VEIRLPVSELEKCPGCHPERSEGSGSPDTEILRCAQDDSHYLHMSATRGVATDIRKHEEFQKNRYIGGHIDQNSR
jgi:hypothetical protein